MRRPSSISPITGTSTCTEAAVGSEPLDLAHRELGIVQRHQDGGAQPRLAVEPLAGDPVVYRRAQAAARSR